ncbi:MAG: rod shape-determining protein MreD [Elusimicrobiaceae bacterium]|nr:rod shape-determining protein MreD [Elusimicrobiaceae bacterium]
MNFLLWPLLFCGFAGAHWFVGQYCAFFGTAPSVLLAATVACAIASAPAQAMAFGFFAGLFADFLAVHLFGGYALLFVITAYAVCFAKSRIYFETPAAQFWLCAALTLLCAAGYMAESLVFLDKPFPVVWRTWFLTPVYNGALCMAAFPFFLLFRPVRRITSGGGLFGR